MNLQQPHFKINDHESYKSYDKPHNDKFDKTVDKHAKFPKLPPNELMNQLVDFDLSYVLPKHDHPSLHSLVEDRYKRLLYGQFHEQNPMLPAHLYESHLMPEVINQKIPNHPNAPPKINKAPIKKHRKKDLEHFKLPNGGQAQFLKMGIIK